jgi:hypothetical protein
MVGMLGSFLKCVQTFVENIVFIDFKDKGILQMSKIKIARWRLLEILFLYFLCSVWIPYI